MTRFDFLVETLKELLNEFSLSDLIRALDTILKENEQGE